MDNSYRLIAIDILTTFETDKKTLKEIFNLKLKNKNLSSVTKNRCRVTVNEVMRLKGILDFFILKFSSRPIKNIQLNALNILRIASYEMLFDDLIPNFAADSIHLSAHSSEYLFPNIVITYAFITLWSIVYLEHVYNMDKRLLTKEKIVYT